MSSLPSRPLYLSSRSAPSHCCLPWPHLSFYVLLVLGYISNVTVATDCYDSHCYRYCSILFISLFQREHSNLVTVTNTCSLLFSFHFYSISSSPFTYKTPSLSR